ncbi:MAG: hypothetical protein U5J98_08890 [Halobacteriales archaeon]|nr:hypothetical protein [Halobacteriales archaeon]
MNLDDLRSTQVDERGTDSLQPLRSSFYADAAAYLADLRERRARLAEEVDDPYAEEVQRLTDELETAGEVVEAIHERRVGKLVKRASLAAAGMPADEEGLTDEECELFGDLVERIKRHRSTVLDTLEGEGDREAGREPPGEDVDPEAAPEPPADVPATDEELDAASAMGVELGDEAPAEPEADDRPEPDGGTSAAPPVEADQSPADDADRLTVRITASVGEIYGVDDRVYTLDAEDVVSLPAPNAKPLLDRGAAQRVD